MASNVFPFVPVAGDEDELDPRGEHVYVNCYDVKQFVNKYGHDACLGCSEPFTNRGAGMLCPYCDDLLKDEDLT
jgi:hypothetical protein